MQKLNLGNRKFKSFAEAKNTAAKLSARSPRAYFFMSVIFDQVDIFQGDHLPYSDHAANDWPLGYWKAGQAHRWSEARVIRAQNAGETCDR